MDIVEKKLSELIPYENNPRLNDDAVPYVKCSIEAFGFKVPLVIDGNNVIVAGHTRFKAASELGMETVPCVVADDLTDEQIKAFRLADNKVAEIARWDFNKLDAELFSLETFPMETFGFSEEVKPFDDELLDELFADAPEKEKKPKMIKCPHCGEEFEA